MKHERNRSRPPVAVTMGDPAGIGPELVARVLSEDWVAAACRPVVIGDADVLEAAAQVVGSHARIVRVDPPGEPEDGAGGGTPPEAEGAGVGTIEVFQPKGVEAPGHRWGALDPAFGGAAARCLEQALARGLGFRAVVSAPLNKEAFHRAGCRHADELAYMAELTGSRDTSTAGSVGDLWTISVTEHVPFRKIVRGLKPETILRKIRLLDGVLARVSPKRRSIVVAALNPHGGEGGLLGREEQRIVRPAVKRAAAEGIDVTGPVPADTVFVGALEAEMGGVVCLYHDQANIARKLLARRGGTTVFLGLPVPVTTTAHGTAFDIAGTGRASPDSMRAALSTALSLIP